MMKIPTSTLPWTGFVLEATRRYSVPTARIGCPLNPAWRFHLRGCHVCDVASLTCPLPPSFLLEDTV